MQAFLGGKDVAEFGFGGGVVALLGHHPGDLAPGGQHVRLLGAVDAQLGGEDVAVFGFGGDMVALLSHHHGNVVPEN